MKEIDIMKCSPEGLDDLFHLTGDPWYLIAKVVVKERLSICEQTKSDDQGFTLST